ncbi:MAG: hypothetical protein KDC65_15350, partial [Saprospiraceae bacterium]|nr:hypothetical protein [Saprospiraceae bacterium]
MLLLAITNAYGQQADIPEQQTLEVDRLLERARTAKQDDERELLANEGLSLARNMSYNNGIIAASMLLGEVCARNGRNEEALQHYLLAEAKLQNRGRVDQMLVVNRALGDIFLREKKNSYACRYYVEVLQSARDDFETIEKLADAYLSDMRFDSAEINYKKLIVKYKDEGNNPRLVQIYQKLANAYDGRGDLGKSIYYYTAIEHIIETYGTAQEKSLLYNNLGRQYVRDRDYHKALEYFRKAELQCVYIPCDYPEVMYANLGVALHNTGDSRRGIDYLLRARDLLLSRRNWPELASLEHLIAGVYYSNNDYYNALTHNELAIRYARQSKQRQTLADAYETAAKVYNELYDFEKAFDYYRNYLTELDTIRLQEQARQQQIDQQRNLLAAAEGQIKYLYAQQSVRDPSYEQIRLERERLELANKNLALEAQRKKDEVLLLQTQNEVDQSKLREKTLQALQAEQELRLAAQRLNAAKQDNLIAELRRQEEMDRAQRSADSLSRVRELERIQREQEYQSEQEASFRQFVYGIGSLLFIILGLLGVGWYFARRANNRLNLKNKQIRQQNEEIAAERSKSDQLLLNILPGEIAHELKSHGY